VEELVEMRVFQLSGVAIVEVKQIVACILACSDLKLFLSMEFRNKVIVLHDSTVHNIHVCQHHTFFVSHYIGHDFNILFAMYHSHFEAEKRHPFLNRHLIMICREHLIKCGFA